MFIYMYIYIYIYIYTNRCSPHSPENKTSFRGYGIFYWVEVFMYRV